MVKLLPRLIAMNVGMLFWLVVKQVHAGKKSLHRTFILMGIKYISL